VPPIVFAPLPECFKELASGDLALSVFDKALVHEGDVGADFLFDLSH
jgi:hypothetical protein